MELLTTGLTVCSRPGPYVLAISVPCSMSCEELALMALSSGQQANCAGRVQTDEHLVVESFSSPPVVMSQITFEPMSKRIRLEGHATSSLVC